MPHESIQPEVLPIVMSMYAKNIFYITPYNNLEFIFLDINIAEPIDEASILDSTDSICEDEPDEYVCPFGSKIIT